MDFQATCPTGLEDLLADELKALGAEQVRPLKGQVAFSGTLETGFSACLRSHLASRIILVLARVDAPDADALYVSLRELAWEDQIDPRTSFMVDAHGTNERLKNTQFIAERSKDAIVDRIFARRGARPSVDRERPGTVVSLRLRGDRAAVGIVLTGGRPLFARGLGRRQSGIRSDYAAALIRMSGWDGASPIALITQGEALACECALIGEHAAPGLLRPSIGCESWGGFDAALAERIREQAVAERTDPRAPIIILDRNGQASRMRTALRELGLSSQLVSASEPSGFADASALVLDASWVFEDALAQEIALCDQVEQALAACPRAARAALFSHAGLAATLGAEASESRTVPLGRSDAVIEVVDHHRIADIQTTNPIFFRNEIVGSSNTIIAEMFQEKGLMPSKKLAGLMCAAIISDTVIFKSPTATPRDRAIAERLARIGGVSIEELGKFIFAASLGEDKTARDLMYTDFKDFHIAGHYLGVSQITCVDSVSMLNRKEEFLAEMEKAKAAQGYDIMILMLTDVLLEGTQIIFLGSADDIAQAFNVEPKGNTLFLPGVMSRKKQIIPMLSALWG